MKSTNHNQKAQQLKRGQFPLTPGQVNSIIDHAESVRDRLIIQLMAYCGLRRGEVSGLEVDNVDLEKKVLTITGKRQKTRLVPIPQKLAGELSIYLRGTRKKWVFPARSKRGALVGSRINGILKAAAKRADVSNPCPALKNVNPHSLRHTFARELKKREIPLEAVQNVLGHKNLSTTMNIYGLMSSDDVLNAVAGAFDD